MVILKLMINSYINAQQIPLKLEAKVSCLSWTVEKTACRQKNMERFPNRKLRCTEILSHIAIEVLGRSSYDVDYRIPELCSI